MPVVRISDETFRRLQALAIPLVDTPAAVVDRLLNLHERNLKMNSFAALAKVDSSTIERISASGGYLLQAQRSWLDHHLQHSIGTEAFYCRGVGAPMKNVAIGAPIFCVQTGEVPHRVHLWGNFGGWEELTMESAWHAHGEALGSTSFLEWRRLVGSIPSLKNSEGVGLIRFENVTAPMEPIQLDELDIELRQGAMKGRSLTPAEVSRILRSYARDS